MPALKAIISADAKPMEKEFQRTTAMAERWSQGMRGAMNSAFDLGKRRPSTVLNKKEVMSQAVEYADFWQKALLDKDVEAASRSNRARRLMRLRAESRAARGNINGGDLISAARQIITGNFESLPFTLGKITQRFTALSMILNPITAAIAGIGAGAFASAKLVGFLEEKLSGLKLPEFNSDYIAKHLQGANQAAEGQKKINEEIQKTIDLYSSASTAAQRISDATKTHFDHQRKMNEFEKDPKKKAAREVQINKDEREHQLANKYMEAANLQLEGRLRKRQADAIQVGSQSADQNALSKSKQDADEARKFLTDNAPNSDIFTKRRAMRAYNKMSLSNVSDDDILAGEEKARADARQRIQAEKDTINRVAANEEARRKKQELTEGAGQSLSRAAQLGLEIKDDKKKNALANANEVAETAADGPMQTKMVHGNVNALQQVGAYAASASLIDINKRMDQKLGTIARNTAPKSNQPPQGGTIF